MITKDNFKNVLQVLNFNRNGKIFFKQFGDDKLIADFENEKLIYPKNLIVNRNTVTNFSDDENFVVFECVARLLEKNYKPVDIELESPIHGGHHDVIGYNDILVKKNSKTFLLIECKKSDEFNKFWKQTLIDGSQLFNYFNTYRQAQALCLYTSDYSKDGNLFYTSNIISMTDNEKYLQTDKNLKSFQSVRESGGNKEEYFQVWSETYKKEFDTKGIFENEIAAYTIGKLKYTAADLIELQENEIQKKYHEFATIMRQHTVGSHEKAFDKLVNLFLAKIVDETNNFEELKFRWRGITHDDYFDFQDRLQKLYRDGMEKFLNENVTYIEDNQIEEAFRYLKNDPNATKESIKKYFRELKYFSNNDFSFIDVHNEKLFYQNAIILKEMVQMLQDIKLKTTAQNQFLGDLFEGFLDQGVKQNEGQFFTPLPIVKFLISSLPIENFITDDEDTPYTIDYACGAGHFLTEYAEQIKRFSKKYPLNVNEFNRRTIGIEKEYRLSKVAKVSAFMYGHDEIKIIYGDALTSHDEINNDKFSILVANPPYSVKGFLETLSDEQRNKFTLASRVNDISSNNSIETFFVERAKQLLKVGGVAAIILPSSILSNGNIYEACREIILKYFYVIAIVQFGSGAFGKTGTNTVTLFLRRRTSITPAAVHFKDRVDLWIAGKFKYNEIYEDENFIDKYCAVAKIDVDEYRSWLSGGDFPNAKIFASYVEQIKKSAEYKKIAKKSDDEIKKFLNNKIKNIEHEKLYYFILADDSPTSTLIIKSPDDQIKKFLGYEWSAKKGDEGIKYLGAKNINEIQTPLFNPKNFDDEDKINSLIRKNFSNVNFEIPDSLKNFVSFQNLTDLIDFSSASFDKAIKLVSNNPRIERDDIKYYKLSDENLFEIGIGQRVLSSEIVDGGKYPVYSANVFKEFGRINKLNLDDFSRASIIWGIDGDWMVNLIEANDKFYPTDHCGYIRIRTDEILPEYLAIALKIEGEYQRFSRSNRASTQRIKNLSLPIASIDEQKKIITKIKFIDEKISANEKTISDCDEDIKNKFNELFSGKNFETIELEKIVETITGLWSGEKPPFKTVKVIRNTNFTMQGKLNLKDVAVLEVEENKFEKRKLKYGDIILEKSGGSETQAVGRVVLFDLNEEGYSFSNFTSRLRIVVEKINPIYLHAFLNDIYQKGITFNYQHGMSGLKNLNLKQYLQIQIPLPPLDLQKKFSEYVKEKENKKSAAISEKESLIEERDELIKKYFR